MRGLSMGFQSIFARKALPEAEFSKKAFIDGHRFSHIGWFGTRLIVTRDSIISQARNLSNLRCGLYRARGSVRRRGFAQIPITLIYEVIGRVKRKICTRHRSDPGRLSRAPPRRSS